MDTIILAKEAKERAEHAQMQLTFAAQGRKLPSFEEMHGIKPKSKPASLGLKLKMFFKDHNALWKAKHGL